MDLSWGQKRQSPMIESNHLSLQMKFTAISWLCYSTSPLQRVWEGRQEITTTQRTTIPYCNEENWLQVNLKRKDPICGASTQVNNPSLTFWDTCCCVFCASQQCQILSVTQHWGILRFFPKISNENQLSCKTPFQCTEICSSMLETDRIILSGRHLRTPKELVLFLALLICPC